MARSKRYKAVVPRLSIRQIWYHIQQAKPENMSHEDWLGAANRELLSYAGMTIKVAGMATEKAIENPAELVLITLSHDALCGIKLAVVQRLALSTWREREVLFEACECFGEEFAKSVKRAAKLPAAPNGEEDDVEGIPADEIVEVPSGESK